MIKYLCIDTETDGLNIRCSKPFMIQYMFIDEKLNEIEKGIFYINHRTDQDKINEEKFRKVLKEVPTIVGANIKFDIHMLLNVGYPLEILENKNYIDVQVLARLVINADLQTSDKFTVALKKLSVQYLNVDANKEEQFLKAELSTLRIKHKAKMEEYFMQLNLIPKSMLSKDKTVLMNKIYGDNWYKHYQDYPEFKKARNTFLQMHPEPTYKDVSNVNTYALTDVILTHGLFKLWYPEVIKKKQQQALIRSSGATFPLVVMEREGLVIDLKRVIEERQFMLDYFRAHPIIDPRDGKEVSIGQHKVLKEIYEYETGLKLENSDKNVRLEIEDKSPTAKLINQITKLDKLINTYATKLIREAVLIDGEYRVFTQYNLAKTVTGRLSSDFQQFPKESTIVDGKEIHVRSWFKIPKDASYMVYEDYAQQELKLQCEWSGLVNDGKPDINMTRASEPYQCHKGTDGKWYLDESPDIEWKPIDLHALTAKNAFPEIDESHPEWKHYRKLGKSTNFASNYGCSAPTLAKNIKVPLETAQRLIVGYRNTFKGVMDYVKWIKNMTYTHDNLQNLFGRRYYSRNPHQLQNWLVQGSGADILLSKLNLLYNYIKEKPWWKFMITVHDEVGFTCGKIPKEQMVKEAKEIQELMSVQLNYVRVVTDIEVSTTTWADKMELDEFLQKED